MAYVQPFVLLTIFGRFGGANGAETWSTSCKISNLSDATDPTEFLPAVQPAISAFHASPNLNVGSQVYLTELHGAVIGTDGKYVGGDKQATKVYTLPTPTQGAGNTNLPWPTSVVLSLRVSGQNRGRGSHGRMYWPCTGIGLLPTTGRISGGTPQVIANEAATMLKAINTAAVAAFGPGTCVVNTSRLGSGVMNRVDRVLVGDRPDHQERRENDRVELYGSAVV